MITVICGTNRANSNTHKYASHYVKELKNKSNETIEFICLEKIQNCLFNPNMYSADHMDKELKNIQENILIPSQKFVFLSPEYNGSIPGVLKLFIDALSIHKLKETFGGKKAILTGIAIGRAGNLRGMEHLTGMLHHIGITVHPNKLPISACHVALDETGNIKDEEMLKVIDQHIDALLSF